MGEQHQPDPDIFEIQQRAMSHTGELFLATDRGETMPRPEIDPKHIEATRRNLPTARQNLRQAIDKVKAQEQQDQDNVAS